MVRSVRTHRVIWYCQLCENTSILLVTYLEEKWCHLFQQFNPRDVINVLLPFTVGCHGTLKHNVILKKLPKVAKNHRKSFATWLLCMVGVNSNSNTKVATHFSRPLIIALMYMCPWIKFEYCLLEIVGNYLIAFSPFSNLLKIYYISNRCIFPYY